MKLSRLSEDFINELQKFVKFQTLCVFHYCSSNVFITLYESQDDSLYILVRDDFEKLSFWFKLSDVGVFSFSRFRRILFHLYFSFLDDYRERYLNLF